MWRGSILGRSESVALAAFVVLILCLPGKASAQFSAIEDGDYALEIFNGVALGSGRSVAMGGVALATALGSESLSFNSASPAIRTSYSSSKWDWSAHLNWFNPELGDDFDNDSIPNQSAGSVPFITAGLVIQYKNWGVGLNVSGISRTLEIDNNARNPRLELDSSNLQMVLARSFFSEQLNFGFGLRLTSFNIRTQSNQILYDLEGVNIESGLLFKPKYKSHRHGLSIQLPITGNIKTEEISTFCLNNDSCFPLPQKAKSPLVIGYGVAFRFAKSAWNKPTQGKWRDERSLLLASDIYLIGTGDDTFGVEAFSQGQLQPVGKRKNISVRAGAEFECLPGRLRVRAGSYWEPGRFQNESGGTIPGRLHGTFGLELRFLQFRLWQKDYRLRLSFTGDFAPRYANSGVSIGFWN